MITVLYSCKICGLTKAKAFVRPRRPGEDIAAWMDEALANVQIHHSINSPRCEGKKVDLMIPAGNPAGVGYEE